MKKKVSITILVVMVLSLVLGLAACSDKEIVISFNTKGGSSISDITFIKDEVPNIEELVPTMPGHKFVGWYFDEDFTKPYNKDELPKESFTLYAKFEEYKVFTITFETNGGTTVENKKYTEGKTPKLQEFRPTKVDMEFAGWYLDETLTKKYEPKPIDGDIKLYAKWIDSEYSSVIFETGDGSYVDDLLFKRTEKPDLANITSYKDSNVFEGWYFDKELTKPYVKENAPSKTFTVYAKFRYVKGTDLFFKSLKDTLATYNLDKGFYSSFNGNVAYDFLDPNKDIYNWNYGFNMSGNFFNEDLKGNNNLSFEIVDKNNNNAKVFGLKNDGNYLIVESGNLSYRVEGFNVATILTQAFMTSMLPEGSNLANLIITKDMTVSDAIDYLELATSLISSNINYDWVDNVYLMDFEIGKVLDSAIKLVEGIGISMPQEVHDIVNMLIEQQIALEFKVSEDDSALFNNIETNIILNGPQNTENGKLSAISSIEVGKIDNNFTPVISDQIIDINLLKHSVATNFDLLNAQGQVLASYNFTFKMEFDHTQMQDAIIDAISQSSPFPIINSIFTQKTGKIYLDLSHNCGSTCLLKHAANNKNGDNEGPVLTIAYDPSVNAFNNNKIYLALDLRKVVTDDLFKIIPGGLGPIIKPILVPKEMGYLAIVLDIDKLEKASMLNSLPVLTPPDQGGEETPQEGETPNPNAADTIKGIVNVISTLVENVSSNETGWNIGFENIWNSIKAVIPQDKVELASGIVNGLLPNVANIKGSAVTYQNEGNFEAEFNGLKSFMKKNADQEKVFSAGKNKEVSLINGADPVVTLSQDKPVINTKYGLYDNEGKFVLSLDELYAFKDELATIDMSYVDVKGQTIQSKGTIVDIKGIDINKVDIPQTATLVIGRGVGDNLWDLLAGIGGLVQIDALRTIALPQVLYNMEIVISNVTSSEFTQEGIAEEGKAFDPSKEYQAGDVFNTAQNLNITYSNGSTKTILVKAEAGNNLTSVEPNLSKLSFYEPFDIEYSYLAYQMTQKVLVKAHSAEYTFNFTAGVVNTLPTEIKPEALKGEALNITNTAKDFLNKLKELANNSEGKITLPTSLKANIKIKFASEGSYVVDAKIQGVAVKVTFNVVAADPSV